MSINLYSHDLDLPDWGPYSKRYGGISHISDKEQGLRFDLSIMPGSYRRQMIVPNEKWESGQYAWESDSSLNYYSYRYEIEWKDQIYCDASFSAISKQSRLVRCEFVNNTDSFQDLMVHLVASMNFPPVKPYCDDAIKLMKVSLPTKALWTDAIDYENLAYAVSRPSDNLIEDGMMRAEIREHGFVNGNGIGDGFGKDIGDWVEFSISVPCNYNNASLLLRYQLSDTKDAHFKLKGLINSEVIFHSVNNADNDNFGVVELQIGNLSKGQYGLRLESESKVSIALDGFSISETDSVQDISFNMHHWKHIPEIIEDLAGNNLILKYSDADIFYGLAWNSDRFRIRELFNNELDTFLKFIVPDHVNPKRYGPGEGHFTDVYIRPISMPPISKTCLFGLVCSGTRTEVETMLNEFHESKTEALESIYLDARKNLISPPCLPSGETYRFSQERMAAVEMLNVVYPVYTRRQFIRHSTPGKWWDCLYTWDSGFIGLALLEIDKQRAIENLNAYLTPEGDTHAAFIHHGSPVPTQMYLYFEIWNQTQDKEMLAGFYPSMRQYYLFLSGQLGSSTTRELKSNLLRTWEYFFESGGWDDYPAQIYTLESCDESRIACVAITAHVIRSAKILLAVAESLGHEEDYNIYLNDIDVFSSALQTYSWDEKSGYFSYVEHDKNGLPTGILKTNCNKNYNMGLDGVLPLFSGICTEEQEMSLFEKLQDPSHLWTDIGISTVDRSAPYYKTNGYWNGAVWMPQQWFIWKTALDLGQAEFAHKIAKTALDVWKSEVEMSYYCYEHFIIGSSRGVGWHQFSGLSSPVVSWFHAYYTPGRITVGMDIWIEKQQFQDDNKMLDAQLKRLSNTSSISIIVNMNPKHDYVSYWESELIPMIEIHNGSFQLDIPFSSKSGNLMIREKT